MTETTRFFLTCTGLGFFGLLVSCVAPQATSGTATPAVPSQAAAPPPVPPEQPALVDDDVRLPDMLVLPDEGDFRASRPPAAQSGAVIAKPPSTPPTPAKSNAE
ncbi:MAG: hypothetical protein JHD23_11035 [Akkermansiaceae bacterium]|nr:hypothetical protein [Akkermansiaceae bacterium]